MRLARKMRSLSMDEINLAYDVFKNSLPSWERIVITDGLGPLPTYNNPYTDNLTGVFRLNLGPEVYSDASDNTKYYDGFGRCDALFIHEMTHVWQYYHGYCVVLPSLWANTLGAGYEYLPGAPWGDYNVEQQAHIVEDWHLCGQSSTDARFVYIDRIIRPGIESNVVGKIIINLPVDELQNF
jgi:hypothetical protein